MAQSDRPRLLAIVGPTAGGKSALAVSLAQRLGGEVLSCDSMQVYRGMDIGTAKPTPEEMGGIPHHLIDIADPHEPFSCAEYVAAAERAVAEVLARGRLPVFCGGTGLYLDRFLSGGMEEGDPDPELRRRLFAVAESEGAHALHERLRAVDPESAEAIHENNVKRVVRALEIYHTTGIPKSESDRRSQSRPARYNATVIGLHYADREPLYRRIDRRVEEMLAAGLLEETQRLNAMGVFACNRTAAQAIGYKELLPHLRGEEPLEAAAERLKLATRHYAKRQQTWFDAKAYVHPLEALFEGQVRPLEELTAAAEAIFAEGQT